MTASVLPARIQGTNKEFGKLVGIWKVEIISRAFRKGQKQSNISRAIGITRELAVSFNCVPLLEASRAACTAKLLQNGSQVPARHSFYSLHFQLTIHGRKVC
jgi:hypothetical protein